MNMIGKKSVCIFLIVAWVGLLSAQDRYRAGTAVVKFTSDAPLELIQAESRELQSIIDVDKNAFAFAIPTQSFQGFNSPLQREHFNENYLESKKYPRSTFSGKMIEKIDFTKDGEYTVRAKGALTIHGIEQERIIKSQVTIEGGKITVSSDFTVLLEEHNIAIPRIVHQKIAEEIAVSIYAEFSKAP